MSSPLHDEFQAWLDRWVAPFLANDHDAFFNMLQLPFSVRSHGSEWVVSSYEQSQEGFNAYRKMLLDAEVDLPLRVLRTVDQISETEVKLLYENYLMKGTTRAFRPSGAEAYLRFDGTEWKATRAIEVEFSDPNHAHLPSTRADRMHDQVLKERLRQMSDTQMGDGETND